MSILEDAIQGTASSRARLSILREWLTYWIARLPFVAIFGFILGFFLVDMWVLRSASAQHHSLFNLVVAASMLAVLFTAGIYIRTRVLDIRVFEAQRYKRDVGLSYEAVRAALSARYTSLEVGDQRRAVEYLAKHLSATIDGLAAVTSKLIRAETAVSVKLFRLPPNPSDVHVVVSFVRDTKSQAARSKAPRSFPYNRNSAFETIIRQNSPKASFRCADLLSLDRAGLYKNDHEQWRQYYTSTLVLPICDQSQNELGSLLGFLCIDSYAGDVTHRSVRAITYAIAGELFRTMALVDEFIVDEAADA